MNLDEEETILRYYIGEKFIELFTCKRNDYNEYYVYFHTTTYNQDGEGYKFRNTYHIFLTGHAITACQWEGYPVLETLRISLADPDGVTALQDWIDSNIVKTSPNIRETLERP